MQRFLVLALVVVIGILIFNPFFIVNETEHGIVSRFRKVLRDDEGVPVVYAPGLHIRIPFADSVRLIDARLQTLDSAQNRFITADKKDLLVDFYAKWRVQDTVRFFLSTNGDYLQAESLLSRMINNGLRTEFGRRTIPQIVSGERDELMEEALKQAAESAKELGIEVVDVRVKTINLPAEVSQSIFQRMRSDRQVVAREHRSKGAERAEIIRAEADRRVTMTIAEAQRKALELRGDGEGTVAKIYADTYSKKPEFFRFLRSLDAYKQSLARDDKLLVVSPEGDFFRYFGNDSVAQE